MGCVFLCLSCRKILKINCDPSTLSTCFTDPLKISFECFTEVFSHSQLPERFSSLHSGSFIAKFPERGIRHKIGQTL